MKLALTLGILVAPTLAFTPMFDSNNKVNVNINNNRVSKSKWELHDLIYGFGRDGSEVEGVDPGSGGVRLAEESAIKLKGSIKHKPGKADAMPDELIRYKKLTSVTEATVKDVLKKAGSRIICTGQGVELYKDPGNTVEKIVFYGPMEAIKDAFVGAAPAIDCNKLVFNFLGGDDLIMGEVLDAANELVVMLDINTGAEISFNSLSHQDIPDGTCAVTVVSVGDNDVDKSTLSDAEKSILAGEFYLRDNKWYTVEEGEINPALA